MDRNNLSPMLISGGEIPINRPLQYVKLYCSKGKYEYEEGANNVVVWDHSNVIIMYFKTQRDAKRLVDTGMKTIGE